MASKSISISLLFLLAAGVFSRDRLTAHAQASRLNCSHGLSSHTPVSNGDVLNLRQGETLLFNCKGDPNGDYAYFSLGDDYPDTRRVYMKDESTLNYTWYIEPYGNEAVIVHGFHHGSNPNADELLRLQIRVHDLDSYINCERATTNPSPPPERTTTAGQDPNGKVVGNRQSTDGYPTERATEVSTPMNNIEKYALYVTTAILAALVVVVVLSIAVIVMAKILYHRKSKVPSPEDGGTGQTIHAQDAQDDQDNSRHEESVSNTSSDSLRPSQ